MLQKVVEISGLGLLHQSGASPKFTSSTLLFAENGRGKSTFMALLESLRVGDVSSLGRLSTIDQQSEMHAKLIFDTGPATSELNVNGWDHCRPDLRVFDTRFIRDNVYSGAVVEADHRRNLLEFALGDRAVSESAREREATTRASELAARIRETESALVPSLHGWTLGEFESLTPAADIEADISALDAAISTTRNIDAMVGRPRPTTIGLVRPDLAGILAVLSLSLQSIEDVSERLAHDHFERVGHDGIEEWARAGAAFEDGRDCPYCGQSVEGSALLAAYRSFFGEEYETLLASIQKSISDVERAFGTEAAQALTQRVATERETNLIWATDLELRSIDLLDVSYQKAFADIRTCLLDALNQKAAAPLTSFSEQPSLASSRAIWDEVEVMFGKLNVDLDANAGIIDNFVSRLRQGSLTELLARREKLEGRRSRFLPEVVELVTRLAADRFEESKARAEKTDARNNVRVLMDQTLSRYQDKINVLLQRFGATFAIDEMRTNFKGSAPQSEFVIGLRQKPVPLKSPSGPDFDSALSEGDKRTLAFAFFAAQVLDDAALGKLMVAIDDPMSSMDANRRAATIQTIVEIQSRCSQLILSSHDPTFLREYRKLSLRQDKSRSTTELQLSSAFAGYSEWGPASLDELCESEYLTTYRSVTQFVRDGAGDPRQVGAMLRPLLEGYLHRRFPTLLAEGLTLGECIQSIRNATQPSALVYAAPIANEVEEINTFAGRFHHQNDPGFVQAMPTATEVGIYAGRALDVVHGKP